MGEYCVIDVPELATIKIKSGQKLLVNGPPKEQSEATRNLIQEMMAFEDSYIQKAKNDPRDEAVVIFDRGVMDNLAYMGQPALDYFRQHKYLDLDTIRDSRYDMVIHMKSAADGAPEFYTLANNTARSESVDRAKELDREILKSWTGHRNHKYSLY